MDALISTIIALLFFVGLGYLLCQYSRHQRSLLEPVALPVIPGDVYVQPRAQSRAIRFLLYALLLAGGCWVWSAGDPDGIFAVVGATLLMLGDLVFMRLCVRTHVDLTMVNASFEGGREIRDSLDNYFLYIAEAEKGRGSKHYAYCIKLRRKDAPAFAGKNHRSDIMLCERLFTPESLKEWVVSFQTQTEKPLEMLFGSEQILKDYQSGKYMA